MQLKILTWINMKYYFRFWIKHKIIFHDIKFLLRPGWSWCLPWVRVKGWDLFRPSRPHAVPQGHPGWIQAEEDSVPADPSLALARAPDFGLLLRRGVHVFWGFHMQNGLRIDLSMAISQHEWEIPDRGGPHAEATFRHITLRRFWLHPRGRFERCYALLTRKVNGRARWTKLN